jgi:hypothetical protein
MKTGAAILLLLSEKLITKSGSQLVANKVIWISEVCVAIG